MLLLGPIVGHTTHESARVWIRGRGAPSEYRLRIKDVGIFPFVSTGANADLFGTAITVATGLKDNWLYHYDIIHKGRVLGDGKGQFRTKPLPNSWMPQSIFFASCSHNNTLGAWSDLCRLVLDLEPHALFLIGDQVYQDNGREDLSNDSPLKGGVWDAYLGKKLESPKELRKAMAGTYQVSWERPEVAKVLRSCATYMMWDDHDIRDGWGSWACDSPTIAAENDGAARICGVDEAYFQAARETAWHFQLCRNPLEYPRAAKDGISALTATRTYGDYPGVFAQRTSFGFAVEAGRTAQVVIDSRGNRDLWRKENKVLGAEQWRALEAYVDNLTPDIDAVIFVTPVPIVATGPMGVQQSSFEGWQDDAEFVKAGEEEKLRDFQKSGDGWDTLLTAGVGLGTALSLPQLLALDPVGYRQFVTGITKFRHGDLDDARDQWSNEHSRPEQNRLLRLAYRARTHKRIGIPRSIMFVGGDLHYGACYTIYIDGDQIPAVISSGISKQDTPWGAGLLTEGAFDVAPGIIANKISTIGRYNFTMLTIDSGPRPTAITITQFQAGDNDGWFNEVHFDGYLISGNLTDLLPIKRISKYFRF